tara:strand:+ start:1601 stop:1870 length:270 start_codon:yes stop_codon:yes gene_type:complete
MDLKPVYKFISSYSLSNGDEDKLTQIETELIDEYNEITLPYRDIFLKIDKLRKDIRKYKINNCDHEFERFCEYHNERYYICKKCNYEKQ